jgi:hypothetical protein
MRRILRAFEGEGDEQKYKDFEVNFSATRLTGIRLKRRISTVPTFLPYEWGGHVSQIR